MADLDKIVRPFQLRPRASALPEKVLEVRKPGVPLTLRFGNSGSGKTASGNYSIDITTYQDDRVVEVGKHRGE